MDAKSVLMRLTVCLVSGHKWVRTAYPGSEGDGYVVKCARCGKENNSGGVGILPGPV